jgi:nucleotide-binding universal stress UspA family protein
VAGVVLAAPANESFDGEETPVDEQRTAAGVVVVGVDGSSIALSAVRWATLEAHRRSAPLRIVHVTSLAERTAADERRDASILTLARTTAEKAAYDVPVTTETLAGPAPAMLAEAAADAQLLVVGMGGGERYEDIRLHSTALAVCTAAACAVAVVRGVAGTVPEEGQVVLGLGDVVADAAAVTVAFAEAQRHGAGLVVVHALHGTGPVRDHVMGHGAHTRRRDAAWIAITDALAPWRSRCPDVPVEIRIVDGPAHAHLLPAAVTARLLVLGTHAGRSATARVVLGSTSHTVLRHSPCPVMVVRRDARLTESSAEALAAEAIARPLPPPPVAHVAYPERWTVQIPGRGPHR